MDLGKTSVEREKTQQKTSIIVTGNNSVFIEGVCIESHRLHMLVFEIRRLVNIRPAGMAFAAKESFPVGDSSSRLVVFFLCNQELSLLSRS